MSSTSRPPLLAWLGPFLAAVVIAAVMATPTVATAETTQVRINSIISEYLGKLIDRPARAHSATLAASTNRRLVRATRHTSKGCRATLRRTRHVIGDLDLSAATKRRRVLAASAPVYYRC